MAPKLGFLSKENDSNNVLSSRIAPLNSLSNPGHPIPFYRKTMGSGASEIGHCFGANEIISIENELLGKLE